MSRWRFWSRRPTADDVAQCHEAGRVLQEYLDGVLDPAAAARVRKHLEACRRCGLEATIYDEIKKSLARRPSAAEPAAVERLRRFAISLAEADGRGTGAPVR